MFRTMKFESFAFFPISKAFVHQPASPIFQINLVSLSSRLSYLSIVSWLAFLARESPESLDRSTLVIVNFCGFGVGRKACLAESCSIAQVFRGIGFVSTQWGSNFSEWIQSLFWFIDDATKPRRSQTAFRLPKWVEDDWVRGLLLSFASGIATVTKGTFSHVTSWIHWRWQVYYGLLWFTQIHPKKNGGAPIPSQALKVHCCKKAPQRHGFVWARLRKICTALQAREQVWLSTDIDFPFKIILWYPFVTVHLHSHYSTMHWNQLRTTAAKRP